MTHDSIGLGEDGPTHQPIETLAALRALPDMSVLRPADGNEVSGAYMAALEGNTSTVLCLSRQNLPQLRGTSAEKTLLGAYVIQDIQDSVEHSGSVDVVLVGTGSETCICVEAAKLLPTLKVHKSAHPYIGKSLIFIYRYSQNHSLVGTLASAEFSAGWCPCRRLICSTSSPSATSCRSFQEECLY